jgi:hypothetical protein
MPLINIFSRDTENQNQKSNKMGARGRNRWDEAQKIIAQLAEIK